MQSQASQSLNHLYACMLTYRDAVCLDNHIKTQDESFSNHINYTYVQYKTYLSDIHDRC